MTTRKWNLFVSTMFFICCLIPLYLGYRMHVDDAPWWVMLAPTSLGLFYAFKHFRVWLMLKRKNIGGDF